MKNLLLICLLALMLSACAPAARSVVVTVIPPGEAGGPPQSPTNTPEVKVVEMATQTSVPSADASQAATPTVVPGLPTPTGTSLELPKTLAEMGLEPVTYRDAVGGLEFDYPATWLINSLPEADRKNSVIYTVTLRSRDAARGPKQQEGIPPDMGAVDISVVKNGPKTLEQAVNERRAAATTSESGQPVKITAEDDWTLANGLKVHSFLFNFGKDPAAGSDSRDRMASEVVTMINGQMVLVSGSGDLSLFYIIAASLREIK